ncbi:importin-9 [Trichonephila inaurata madagascariensis]|uniref:Importin-9 n=1 Tax=Trichonephila inaurata madagascariensis TaxID=2747483 RepID=A0A8X6YCH4_9ARAC|nr:importin-9 [Trichonephila inaurata madagascariensis]
MAAPMHDVSKTLKDALFETLTSILSPIHGVRISAEQQINVLEVTDEFAVHLTELMLDQNAPLAIRQLASVLLRQYVESHWATAAEKFRPPEATAEAKAAVRAMLPMGLHESISKLRSSVAYAISAIAQWDWPEDWPELFDILLRSLVSENSNAVHGAMRVLKEISNEVSDSQMPQFAPVILPEMLKIFLQDQKYGIRTRGRAVEIFGTCAELIGSMAPYNKSAPKNLLFPISVPFTEALVSALKTPDGMTSDSGLKKDVLNALQILVRYFPKQMTQWLPHILAPVWNSLTTSVNTYVRTVVNAFEEEDNPVDSDGEALGFENLVFSIFEFINVLVDSSKYKNYIKDGMTDLIYYILLYTQITEDQIKTWSNNPDQFVEDEDDDTYAYSVRISAQDLLLLIAQEFEDKCSVSLCAAITRHIHEADKNTNPNWWKIHESCMLALGSVKDLILSGIKGNSLQFDMPGFIHSVVLEDLNTAGAPFLIGRCLWFASKYSALLNEDLVKRFLQATVSGLQPTQPATVRVSAVRAVWGFCDHLKTTEYVNLLIPYLAPITEGLISLAVQFSSEVLALVLESISIIITIDENFTAQYENKISPIAIAVFLKHNSDPVLITMAEEIFKQLSKTPGARAPMQQRLLPTLVSILQAQPMKVPLGLQAASLDVLQTIVRSSPRPLATPIITQTFPAAVHCIMHSDDNSILQNGGECLRSFVSVALEQVSAWRDESGNSGLDYIINVAQRLLDPKTPENASAFVGRLTSLLISKAGSIIGDKSELLLRAVLSKMQQVEALSVNQSLLMVFAHLVNHQIEPVLDFLSGVPGPTGQSALEFVMSVWCQCHSLFFGAYERKVSAFSLSLILQHGLKESDQRLHNIQVLGDQIFSHTQGPKTRSKSQQEPDQWTKIPLFVKIYKLLLHDLSSMCDQGVDNQEEEESSDEDFVDGCDNGDDSELLESVTSGNLFGTSFSDFDLEKEEIEEDPDIASDPIHTVNLKAYLMDYLQQLHQLPCYSSFSEHLTPNERTALGDLGLLPA